MEKQCKQWQTLFLGAPQSLQMVTAARKVKTVGPWKKSYDEPSRVLKSRDITLPTKVHLVKAMVFPVAMYGYESWTMKKAKHQRTDAFKLWCWRRLLKSPLDCKDIKPVNPKGNQSWIFIGRTDAKAEAPVLWPPDGKSWLTGKDPHAGKDSRQEEKGTTEDEKIGWHHQLNGHEFEQAPGDGEEQVSLACGSTWGCKESDTTEWLNNNNNNHDIKTKLVTYHGDVFL